MASTETQKFTYPRPRLMRMTITIDYECDMSPAEEQAVVDDLSDIPEDALRQLSEAFAGMGAHFQARIGRIS